MYVKATEYLQPIRNFAKFCGTLPGRNLHDSTVSLWYTVYTSVLLAISAYSTSKEIVHHFDTYKDIVCFTVVLTDLTNFVRHMAAIFVPFSLQKVYLRMWQRFEHVESVMQAQNMANKQNLTNFNLYASIMIAISAIVFFSYVTQVTSTGDTMYDFGAVVTHMTFLACTHQIISLASLIKNKFELLNWHLDYLNNIVPLYLLPNEAKILLENKTKEEHVKDKFIDYASNVRETSVEKIRAFNQIHFLLYSSCKIIDRYFSLQIFLCVVESALDIMCACIELFDLDYFDVSVEAAFLVFSCYEFIQVFRVAKLYYTVSFEVRYIWYRIYSMTCTH